MHIRGTQLPNSSGNSCIRSSFNLSFKGPRIITGLVYLSSCCATHSYDKIISSGFVSASLSFVTASTSDSPSVSFCPLNGKRLAKLKLRLDFEVNDAVAFVPF